METFFSADIHFDHARIIDHAGRPFSDVDEMNEGLIARWNAVVGINDEAWFLGDLSFGKAERTAEFFKRLRGRKHLIQGNHDGRVVKELPWASVQDVKKLKVNGNVFELCHFPFEVWNHAHHGAFHLHGHSHGTLQRRVPRRMDVGVDCHPTLSPFSMDEVLERLSGEDFAPADHHGR